LRSSHTLPFREACFEIVFLSTAVASKTPLKVNTALTVKAAFLLQPV
jgi:hypothetical protein